MRKIILGLLIGILVFIGLSDSVSAQVTPVYYCNYIPPAGSGFPKCEPSGCPDGYIAGDACSGTDGDEIKCSAAIGPHDCIPSAERKGFRCDPGVKQCFECLLSEDGCYEIEEDFCWTSCVFGGGNTYSCDSTGTGCVTITGLGGEFTDSGACETACIKPKLGAMQCTTGPGNIGIKSSIGCIPIEDTMEMTEFWMRWGIGLASGFSFLLIIYSAFLIMTSTGDPKKIQAGRELLFSAIAGLIFLIFSVYILRLIGVDILHIPGWGV